MEASCWLKWRISAEFVIILSISMIRWLNCAMFWNCQIFRRLFSWISAHLVSFQLGFYFYWQWSVNLGFNWSAIVEKLPLMSPTNASVKHTQIFWRLLRTSWRKRTQTAFFCLLWTYVIFMEIFPTPDSSDASIIISWWKCFVIFLQINELVNQK